MEYAPWDSTREFSSLIGKTFTKIVRKGDDLLFTCSDGTMYEMGHSQDCCETVEIAEIGDFDDIIGSPILKADEKIVQGDTNWGTETSSFYTLETQSGCFDIRWHGESNGYYSETVALCIVSN